MSGKDDKKIKEGTSKIKEIGSTTHLQCPMLKGANYTTWAIRMQVILEANGLWEMIEPNLTTEVDTKKDKTAIAYIYQSLPKEQLLLISKYKTAKEVWDALKTRHVGVNRVQQAKQQTLKSKFEMLQMEENESIDSFVTRLTGIINKAASVGLAYEDSTIVRKLLNAVPDRFLQIVASIEQYSDLDEMSVDEAIGRLKTFEERLKSKKEIRVDSQESLMFTRHEGQGKPFRERGRGRFNQSRGQENNRFRSERKNWESSQNNFKKETDSNSNKFTHDKSKVLCFKCKEYGHFANKCPSKKEEQSNLIEEDLEPTLLMATVEEAPGSFINQEESRSKNGRKFHSASN
ncbi:zinc finger, CCHC-type containing protein [Tanacetum coccineum]